LDIEVAKCSDGLLLTQQKYASEILRRANMHNCKPTRTPLAADEKLSLTDGDPLSSDYATSYRSHWQRWWRWCLAEVGQQYGFSAEIGWRG
jgi:hypothetical protein